MTLKSVLLAGGMIASLGIGVFVGNELSKPTINQLQEHINRLAEQDSIRRLQLQNTISAYERLSFTYQNEHELRQELDRRNGELLAYLDSAQATITALAASETALRAQLAGMDVVDRTDSTLTVRIAQNKTYDRGEINIDGEVVIDGQQDSASTVLDVLVRTSPVVVFSRNPDGTGQLTIDFGDMPVEVDELHGGVNINDPIHDQTRSHFFDVMPDINIGTLGTIVGAAIAGRLLIP